MPHERQVMSTDQEWERWGKFDPYYGVFSEPRFRMDKLTPEAKQEFFDSGERHLHHVLEVCRAQLDPTFTPRRALDFGCGTGRIVIPLAMVTDEVVGLDVSDSMLSEARKNCEERGLNNVRLLKSDDQLSNLEGGFDLIHSFIVFQHIPVARGRRILANLLSHLNDGGSAAIQMTYSKARYEKAWGVEPWMRRLVKRSLRGPYRTLKRLLHGVLAQCDPEMQINAYSLNEVLFLLQRAGVHSFHAEYTDHGGEFGIFIYFQRPRGA